MYQNFQEYVLGGGVGVKNSPAIFTGELLKLQISYTKH